MKLTAANFHDPLLRVLGSLTNFTANTAVKASDTYKPLMDLLGIGSLNAHGVNKASGQPQVVRWIQWANTDLRKAGLTSAPPKTRGKWMLTPAGVAKARELAAPQVPADTPDSDMPDTPDSDMQDTSAYHADPYIRSLAIKQTPCFGAYSPHKSAVCSKCPLASDCQSYQHNLLSSIAARLAREDEAGQDTGTQDTGEDGDEDPAQSRFPNLDFKSMEIIRSPVEAVCAGCQEPIERGERCRWAEELPGTMDGGLFHLSCSGGET